MRYLCVLLAGCSFSADLAPSQVETVTLTDKTFDGTAIDGERAPEGIVPDGFSLGGLHVRAYEARLVDPGEDFDKVLADAAALTPAGEGYAQVMANWNASRPRGLGLDRSDDLTLLYAGEILLPAGTVTLEADVDDRALVQVALDGTFGELLVANLDGGPDAITFDVPAAGWYPLRAAFTEDIGNARFALTIVQGPVRTPVDRDRLRARISDAPGVVVFAFDGLGFIGPRGQTARPTIDETFPGTPPYDLTGSFDRFSLRFAGQLRIDTQGSYMFGATVADNDGFRIWIDGELVAHRWLGHPLVDSGAVTLEPGWHAIVVDYAHDTFGGAIRVTMNGDVIPPERLRPVVERGHTFTYANINVPTAIPDQASALVGLPLEGDMLTLIDSVDYGFRVDNQDMSQLVVTLFDCTAGKQLALLATPGYHYYPADRSCAGKPTNPPVDWAIRFDDGAPGNGGMVGTGAVRDYGLTALYRGGPNLPFAPVVTYTSPPRATPGATHIEAVRALGKLEGAAVSIEIRTAADAASLEAASFVGVRENVAIEASELVQYRITLSTNGWISPVLDTVEIVYVTAP